MSEKQKRGNISKLFDRITLSLRLMLDNRVSSSLKIIPPLALAYIVSPIDAIPDIFVPIGIVDDVGVALLALEVFIRMAPPEIVREHLNKMQGRISRSRDDYFSKDDPDVIEGEYTIRDKYED